MASNWKDLGSIAPGGTVFAIAQDGFGRAWLGTGAGLFVREGNHWRPLRHGQPLPALTALAASGATVFVGGAQGELLYTHDGGRQWYQGRQDQATAMITSIVPSPNFERDGVALAGTAGAGILRTVDGGRSWVLCNFGLQDFAVTALAVAPVWEQREIAFAATEHGLYRSPNGGRAWKRTDAGLEGLAVQALAVSPNSASHITVFAGAETGPLSRSTDSGRTWAPWRQGLDDAGAFAAINTLWAAPDSALLLSGTADGRILRSVDGGATWTAVVEGDAAILSLGNVGDTLYAGQLREGVLASSDNGSTWAAETLDARGFTRLCAGPGNSLYAFGLQEVLHHKFCGEAHDTQPWFISAPPDASNVVALAASKSALFAGTTTGLWRMACDTWEPLLAEETITAIGISADFESSGAILAGGQSGRIYRTGDGGRSWAALVAPQPGMPVLAIGANKALTLAATPGGQGRVVIWLWHAASGKWKAWHQVATTPRVEFRLTDTQVRCVIGDTLWVAGPEGWQALHVAPVPILRYLTFPQRGQYLLTSEALLHSSDGVRFASVPLPLDGALLQDVAPVRDDLILLSTGGRLWRYTVE